MINLTHVINIVIKELMGTVNAISRVREILGDSANANITSTKKTVAIATPATQASPAVAADPKTGVASATEGRVSAIQAVGAEPTGDGSKEGGEETEVLPVAQVNITGYV